MLVKDAVIPALEGQDAFKVHLDAIFTYDGVDVVVKLFLRRVIKCGYECFTTFLPSDNPGGIVL